MKKLLSITAGVLSAFTVSAQCPQITCPSNITVNNAPGTCAAVVNYAPPVGTNPCGAGSDTFNYSGSIVTWTVPQNVTSVTITAKGAQGGNYGGLGAIMKGDFTVTPGQQLKILVAQKGFNGALMGTALNDTTKRGGGGGGGSFVTDISNNPLIVAGGGGGRTGSGPQSEINAKTTNDGGDTYNNGGGNSGNGGLNGQTNGPAAGGGGLLTDGQASGNSYGGQAFVNGGAGASNDMGSSYPGGLGGFGGGGAGWHNNYNRSGGGGGYSGGQGGTWSGQFSGGGGGSFNSGTNQTNSVGNYNNGQVIISWTGGGATTTQTAGLPDGATFPVGVTTNWYKVEDGLGNADSCSFTVTVVDNEAPSITCPGDTTICWGVYNANITSSDNCPGATVTQTNGPTLGSSFDVGTYNLVFVVTDASGNKDTCDYNVTVEVCGGVNENNQKYGISVYPNPMREYVIIENKHIEGKYTIEITNTLGGIVKTINTTEKRVEIQKGDMSKGMYYYSIKQNNQTLGSGKLAVE
ncbi:MAG: hypothetical protein BroJett020_08780 [Bacteroidota bacterium]|nr:MAG: hypothetical protein BroJett020_08780 [Bacteroidota bacterium]